MHYPIEAPDPIVAIKIRMKEMHLKQVDLVDAIGGKSRVSEILNRKRKLKGSNVAYPVFLMKCFDIMYLILSFGIVSIKCNQYQKWESCEEEE